jgi:DNA-binding NarL/FixJ family response regulator
MNTQAMKILIIEDDILDCNNFVSAVHKHNDIELIGITSSCMEALNLAKTLSPEGIVLDIELNNGNSSNIDSIDFIPNLNKLNLKYKPIIIVTTHINSQRTYDVFHRYGADIILYKGHPAYSANLVLNKFLALRTTCPDITAQVLEEEMLNNEDKISELINKELDLIGISVRLVGRKYLFDAISYLIKNTQKNSNVLRHLANIYNKSETTINNGIQAAINRAWRISAIEDLETYYTARVNHDTGIPTSMEFLYYYYEKIKQQI